MKKHICKLCWREVNEDQMKKGFSGEVGDYCHTCLSIIRKGTGYSGEVSKEVAEEWFKGAKERKNVYEKSL